MNTNGRARTETEIVDVSTLSPTGLKGINAVLGITERGPIGESILVGSWFEYRRHFGGYVQGSIFPQLCKRHLDGGGKLRISRVGHYTDVSDSSTLEGAKAGLTLSRVTAFGVVGDEPTTPSILMEASSVGAWGNNLRCSVSMASDGSENKMDITISLLGYSDLTKTVYSLNSVLTQEDVDRFNTEMSLVKFTSIAVGTDISSLAGTQDMPFESGTQDISAITTSDYIGDSSASTGIYAFDSKSDFVRISVPEKAIPEIDIALVAYVESRKDCRAILRTPIGITGLTAIDYREGNGAYSHAPINSWFASMIYGELGVYDSILSSNSNLPAIADVLALMSKKDSNTKEWLSSAGAKRGTLKNVTKVVYNLGTTARATEFDQLYNAGINPVIDDDSIGAVYWGNRTLYKGNSLLKFENVADLLIYIVRTVNPLAKSELFDPNDVELWGTIYRKVRPVMEAIKSQRGIWDYVYEGDQFVDSIQDAKVNTPDSVDAGAYTFYLWIQPKVGAEYIGIKVAVTNSGVNLTEVAANQSNN